MLKKMKSGFSLMEMMIVLLIISIIAAATAPMITKKMARGTGSGDSPWVFTGDRNSIGYLSKNGQVLIGASKVPEDAKQSKLYIAGAQDWSHIRFGNSNNSSSLGITANPGTGNNDSAIGISNSNIPNGCIMFGVGQTIGSSASSSVAIGNEVEINGVQATAVGRKANATISDSTAIGGEASATGEFSTAVGVRSIASAQCATAYGDTAHAKNKNATALGTWSTASEENSVAIGPHSTASGPSAIAIGESASSSDFDSVAIGKSVDASGYSSVSLGWKTISSSTYSTALGPLSTATKPHSLAVGYDADAAHSYSTAIGRYAKTTATKQIVLGTSSDTVYIPGNLVVDGNVILGRSGNSKYVFARVHKVVGNKDKQTVRAESYMSFMVDDDWNGGDDNFRKYKSSKVPSGDTRFYSEYGLTENGGVNLSDRRLKNVGEKYTAGLEELKKLDFFHYTYKKDEEKTPHVGVIAQDLQKVFPDAVIKGEDGYLRIRMEDMFYAVINAVKELDLKITVIVEKVDSLVKDFSEMKTLVENQQNEIKDLKAQNKEIIEVNQELIKRIEKLEKKSFKKD